MARDSTNFRMEINTKVSDKMAVDMDKVFLLGKMVRSTMVNGSQILCMERAALL